MAAVKTRKRYETDGNGLHEPENEARLPRTKVVTRWECVTPEVAARYRSKVGRNRHFIPSLAQRWRADMDADQWQVTHEGIAFDTAGEMIDGQHRCDAIVESGKPQWLLVTRGLPVGVIEVINRGRIRTLAHQLQILGHTVATNHGVAVARAMMVGPIPRTAARARSMVQTDTTVRKFLDRHAEAIMFAQTVFNKPQPPCQVPAVLARAFYFVGSVPLTRFGAACRDELPAEEQQAGDRTARLFYAYLQENRKKGRAIDHRNAIYRKTQRALRAYLDGEDLAKLYETEEDLFPVSGTGA